MRSVATFHRGDSALRALDNHSQRAWASTCGVARQNEIERGGWGGGEGGGGVRRKAESNLRMAQTVPSEFKNNSQNHRDNHGITDHASPTNIQTAKLIKVLGNQYNINFILDEQRLCSSLGVSTTAIIRIH